MSRADLLSPQAQEQVESIFAFASYAASAPAVAQEAAADQLLSLLSELPSWEIELAVGAQGTSFPPRTITSNYNFFA
jgi:hypothetical protein